jgi:hypothetical protein
MRYDQGQFHLAERELGDVVGSDLPRTDREKVGFLRLAVRAWGVRQKSRKLSPNGKVLPGN